jgi:tetratricopeptide (TPR) repeat protein
MADYYDLGSYHRPIATSSPEAQLWFDRGLNWTYGFNHEEAIRCFERALEHDPDCVMARWGIAFAGGPNYNVRWEMLGEVALAHMVSTCYAATQRAVELLDKATPVERGLIIALQARYPAPVPAEDCYVWSDDYANAMRRVYDDFSTDLDVATLFADALMNRAPWKLWDLEARAPAEGLDTLEALQVLEQALGQAASRSHPGVLHMYIHLMEMSPYPERALQAADLLRDLVPDAGHLRHMATHIDVLCGYYHDVVASNTAAITADAKYVEREGAMNVYTMYRIHNHHFRLYGAMFLAQFELALEAADELIAAIPRALLDVNVPVAMADHLEPFFAVKLHALIRFGRWQEIIDTPLPDDQVLFCVTTAMTHYAKGIAFAATGKVDAAKEQQRLFTAAVSRVPETRIHLRIPCADLLAVAAEMLAGEIAYREGNYDTAFAHLRQSVTLYDGLTYAEPWAWMQPARHALGALLLEQDRVEEAEAIYRADLGLDDTLARAFQHPENVWSLHGYHECSMRLGKHDQCSMIKQRLDLAAARADIPIESSCACRMSAAAD